MDIQSRTATKQSFQGAKNSSGYAAFVYILHAIGSIRKCSVHVERYITNADMIMICSVVNSIDNNVTIEISDDENR